MNIEDQIKAGKDLLLSKGVSQEHADYYATLMPALAQKAIGLVTTHFPKLLELAGAHEEESDDNAKLVNFSLGCRIDFSDTEVYDLKVKMGYSLRVTDSTAAQGPVHGEGEGELPLTDHKPEPNPQDDQDAVHDDDPESPLPEPEVPAPAETAP